MIDINEFYNDSEFKKVCMIYNNYSIDDVMRIIFSTGIVASRNSIFSSLVKSSLEKGQKDLNRGK